MARGFARAAQDLALLLLGLFAGAMLVIGVAFVGFWRSVEPGEFLAWFAAHSDRIGALMVPLGAGATVTAAISTAATWRAGGAARMWSVASTVLAVLILIVYVAVHHSMNEAFVRADFPPERVAPALETWAYWHWVRVALGIAAFLTQIRAMRA